MHFVGYLYIMDMINAWKMEHILKNIQIKLTQKLKSSHSVTVQPSHSSQICQ
jgi:hypothetical protein